jgi:hypothetical protein
MPETIFPTPGERSEMNLAARLRALITDMREQGVSRKGNHAGSALVLQF